MTSNDIAVWLQDEYKFNIVAIHDISNLNDAPYNTIHKILKDGYRRSFEPFDRIVLYSSNSISLNILSYIQKETQLIDISNNFILLISPEDLQHDLEKTRIDHSTDEFTFSYIKKQLKVTQLVHSTSSDIPKPLPDNFCFMPWTNLKITNQGEIKPCCVYQLPTFNRGKELDISTDSISDAYFSDDFKKLRTEFKEGIYPEGCFHCQNLEKSGLPSNRLWGNGKMQLLVEDINLEEPVVSNLISFELELGIACNLKCRICNPRFSSKILAEQLKISSSIELLTLRSKGNFIKDNDNFWKEFDPLLPSIKILEFYGGEPTLISNHRYLLQKLIDKNYARNVSLHYNTNGTNFSNTLTTQWNYFKEVDIAFSIDDINNRFEYQRNGASWKDVNYNIDQYLGLSRSVYKFSLYITVNIQNVFYLPDLLEWYHTKPFDALHLNILDAPEHFNIRHLSRATKDAVIKKLKSSIYANQLSNIVKLLTNNDVSDAELSFINHIQKIDKIRDENFADSHPEMADLLGYVL